MMAKEKVWVVVAMLLAAVGVVEIYLWTSENPGGVATSRNAASEHLEPGATAPSFEAVAYSGERKRIDYPASGPKTLVFIISLTCDTCTRTVPHWNRLAREAVERARTLGVVIGNYDNEMDLLRSKNLAFEAVRFSHPNTQFLYKVTRVPQTLLIEPGGKVEKVVLGELGAQDISDFLRRIGAPDLD
jgi:cytochrome oxidase Cu insertion factor (SCO1/SenC/PrrC family)